MKITNRHLYCIWWEIEMATCYNQMQHQNILVQIADKLKVQDSYKSSCNVTQNNISLDTVDA